MRILPSSLLLIAAVCLAPGAWAQIPVTDGAAIANSQAEHVEAIAKYVEQIQQLKLQVEQMRQQYAALTGGRGLGAILNDPRLREYLPEEWQKVYDAIRSGGYEGLTGAAREIYDANKVYDTCIGLVAEARQTCEAQAVKPAQDKAFALEAYNKARERLNQIESLMQQINQTEDPKAIAEIQGRIAAEQAAIQNEQTKLQMFALISQAEDRLQQQRRHELTMREFSKPGGVFPPGTQPLQFNQSNP